MSVVTVAWKLVQPGSWPLGCLAEELALEAIIDQAEAVLLASGSDADLAEFRELATKDNDYLMLFDMSWDGIEDSDLGRQEGVVNLAFDEWFEPFYDEMPVHPYVAAD